MERKNAAKRYRELAARAAKVAKRTMFALPAHVTRGREARLLMRFYRKELAVLGAAA